MDKKNLLVIGLLMIGIVIAGGIGLINTSFTPTPIDNSRVNGTITFDCNGKQMSIYLDEPDMNYDDDFEYAVRKACPNQEVTNVQDWTGRDYKEKTIDGKVHRSFDEIKLSNLDAVDILK